MGASMSGAMKGASQKVKTSIHDGFSMDLDDLLSYKTEKKIYVRHKWVGLVYLVTIAAILIYTVVFTIIVAEGYLSPVTLMGDVKGRVDAPSVAELAAFDGSSDADYCAPAGTVPTLADYAPVQPCVYPDMDHYSKLTPGESAELLIGTRHSSTVYVANSCNPYNFTCDPWDIYQAKTTAYIGGIEAAMISIQTVVSNKTRTDYSSDGDRIYDTFNVNRGVATVKCESTGLHFQVDKQLDYDQFNVSMLLWVAGIDLDDTRIDNSKSPPELVSYRHDGLTVRVEVKYKGDATKGETAMYTYYVTVNRMEAKLVTVKDSADVISPGTFRYQEDLHGLQILFSQEGDLSIFDFSVLFISLLSGAALIGVAKIVADNFLIYLAPRKDEYRLFVESATPDFHPDTPAEKRILEQCIARKRQSRALAFREDSHSIDEGPGASPLLAGEIKVDPAATTYGSSESTPLTEGKQAGACGLS